MIELVGGALRALVSETGAELCALDGADGTECLCRGYAALWARNAPVLSNTSTLDAPGRERLPRRKPPLTR